MIKTMQLFKSSLMSLMCSVTLRLSKEGRRITYSVSEYEPLLDSANMTVDDYGRLAKDIKVM